MKAIFKLWVKIYLFLGPAYATIMAIGELFSGTPFSIRKFAFNAIGFGVITTSVLVWYHISQLKEIGVWTFTDDNLGTRLSEEMSSSLGISDLKQAIEKDKLLGRLATISLLENAILIKTKATWGSWGEVIDISQSTGSADGLHRYSISNKPRFWMTLVDYGKGMKNMQRLRFLLEAA